MTEQRDKPVIGEIEIDRAMMFKVSEQPDTYFTIDLNVHDTYSGEDGFPEKPEPLVWYIFGPFPTEEEAIDWGNRNLQLFGTTAMPVTDPRDYGDDGQ